MSLRFIATPVSTTQIPELLHAIADRFGDNLVAIGPLNPITTGTLAHAKVAYNRHESPFGADRTWVVHEAVLYEDGQLFLHSGHYDLTREQAIELVR